MLQRTRTQLTTKATFTSSWLRECHLDVHRDNPPSVAHISKKVEYVRRCAIESAYVPTQGSDEPTKAYKRKVYNTLLQIHSRASYVQEMRIQKIWPATDWNLVWYNLHSSPVPESMKATWFHVIHDLTPTNVRLHKIRLSNTDLCKSCGAVDDVLHRMTTCGEGQKIWSWTARRLAKMLRTTERYIPTAWLLRPDCTTRPLTKRRAVQWLLAHTVQFHINRTRDKTLDNYIQYVRTQKRIMYAQTKRHVLVDNFLCVVDED